jgi:hypothetical protein
LCNEETDVPLYVMTLCLWNRGRQITRIFGALFLSGVTDANLDVALPLEVYEQKFPVLYISPSVIREATIEGYSVV